jgi:hypothetical protein
MDIIKTPKETITKISNKTIFELKFEKPECQRAVDNEQVNSMLSFQVDHHKKYNCFFFPNTIIIARFEGKNYIVDGQHRINCIERLTRMDNRFDFYILVNTISVDSIQELDHKYIAVNKNKPVPLYDNMDDWKHFATHIQQFLNQNFSIYFSKAENPHIPNFNEIRLMSYINDRGIASKANNNYIQFIKEIKMLNLFYQQSYSSDNVSNYFSSSIGAYIHKAVEKQIANPFVLGIFRGFEWIDRIVYKMNTGTEYEQMQHIKKNTRVKIKKGLRRAVWEKHSNQTTSTCYVCKTYIDSFTFECGHIESVFYGGKTHKDNLVPICSSCNKDMGIQNLMKYKEELDKQI